MTENTTRTATAPEMKTVDHTHPDTGRPFGEAVVYQRGPTIAADGGARASEDEHEAVEDANGDEEVEHEMAGKQMKDVDHKPPEETEANRVFERGSEGRDDAK